MTEPTEQDVARIAATKAEFNVGTYSDGSGPVVRVKYDAASDRCREDIWLDQGEHSGQRLAFPVAYTEALIAAIQEAATGLRAHLQKDQT